jgi:hypothetical protein
LKSVINNKPNLANTTVPKKIDVANLTPKKKTLTATRRKTSLSAT